MIGLVADGIRFVALFYEIEKVGWEIIFKSYSCVDKKKHHQEN